MRLTPLPIPTCLALAVLCAWPHGAAAQAALALRPAALVAGPRIVLADVAAPLDAAVADSAAWRGATDVDLGASTVNPGAAAIDSGPSTMNPGVSAMKLGAAAIDLGPAPLPGYTQRLARAEIERLLRARGHGWRLQGAEAVAVERRARQVDGATLAAAAERHLRAVLADQADRLELQLAALPADVAAAEGTLALQPRALAPQAALRPRATVWLDVLADGVFQRSAAVTFDVKAYRAALVAQQPLAAGAVPDCASLARRETDVAPLGGAVLDIPCAALRGRLKRAMAAGEALPAAWLDNAAVAQGDDVTLQLRDGAIVLESRAVALDGGDVGQRIAVRPAGATHAVHARIAGPGLVTLTGK